MKLFALLFVICGASVRADDPPCEVYARTENGIVCGIQIRASNGDPLASFLSIPYARAPIGKLRFAEPEPPYNWTGIFAATARGPVCPQIPKAIGVIMDPTSTAEDCLHVNVHVPLYALPDPEDVEEEKPLLKVFVFVHGGAFEAGSGDPDAYGPEFLTAKGIILVTFNYRLGPFGFLSLNSKYVPGNAGLRDIIFVLKWVKNNIRNFGGDPDDVTLGGVSAGASLAHLVAISPATKGLGLFKKVLIMSGTGISEFFTTSPNLSKLMAVTFLYEMGINMFQSPRRIYKDLIDAPLEEIYGAVRRMHKTMGTRLNFMPVVETPAPKFTTVIPEDPDQLVNEGYDKEYPTLVGFTNSECEAYKRTFLKFVPKMRQFPPASLPPRILFGANIVTIPVLTEKISKEFFNGSIPTLESYKNMCSYGFYKYPSMRLVQKRLKVKAAPTWVYEFSYEYQQYENFLKKELNLTWEGVAHTEDFSYIFRTNMIWKEPTHSDELTLPESDIRMRNWMTTLFTNFIKFGRPTEDPKLWPPTEKRFEFLSIKEPFKYDVHPATSYMLEKKRFFDKLVKTGQM